MNTDNFVHLSGTVKGEPLVREIAKGREVARFTLAVTVTEDSSTIYHSVVAWGRIANKVRQSINDGSAVQVDGRQVKRSYTSRNGELRQITEVTLSSFTND